jgi:hypothetical protein
LSYFLIELKKNGLTFKLGIGFGVLYFIFIPVMMMLATGSLLLPIVDFGRTSLQDVVLKDNVDASWILAAYLGCLLLYLFSPGISVKSSGEAESGRESVVSWKAILALYGILNLYILIRSGMLEGGNWYNNRHDFMAEGGAFAVLMVFALNASKILLTLVLYQRWSKSSKPSSLTVLIAFVLADMILSGNRVYAFVAGGMIVLNYFKRFPVTVLKYAAISLPTVFVLGYFGSIYRHMRGPLFEEGFPSVKRFWEVLVYAINHEPPDLYVFLSGISESVNVNVIYGIFNLYDDYLFGSTYLKTLLFPIPRSIWPEKPISITNLAGQFFESVSLVTTTIGEAYMNFSLIGIFLLPLILIFTEYFLKVIFTRVQSSLAAIPFFAGLLLFRMPYSDTILVFLIVYMILIATTVKFTFTVPFMLEKGNKTRSSDP